MNHFTRAGVLLTALASVSLAVAGPAAAEETLGYSHDSTNGMTNTDWMKLLKGSTLLSELSVPGTHDSGAYLVGGDDTRTQSMTFSNQLQAGIRAWDIRLRVEDNGRLTVYHGIMKQGQDFESDVLGTANKFLDEHPNETLLMRVKHETGPTEGFAAAVRNALDKYHRDYRGESNNPTLDDIRGKFVVLQNFDSDDRFGIPWDSLSIQDDYNLGSNWDLANKWREIKAQLDAAQWGSRDKTFVNFLSGSGGSFPYFVASGHSSPGTDAPNLLTGWTRGVIDTCGGADNCISQFPSVNCFLGTCSVAFQGTNVITMDELRNRSHPARFGIIYADYPGRGLVSAVIDANA